MEVTESKTLRVTLTDDEVLDAIRYWLNYASEDPEAKSNFYALNGNGLNMNWELTGVKRTEGAKYREGATSSRNLGSAFVALGTTTEFRFAQVIVPDENV